jgi:hypothetical protein
VISEGENHMEETHLNHVVTSGTTGYIGSLFNVELLHIEPKIT